MSISSISNPTALLSQVTGKNPFAVATPFGASSFVSTLLQELQQSGASSAASGAAGTTSASAAGASTTAAGANTTAATSGSAPSALQAHFNRHGHHGGGMSQLIALLQQSQASGSTGSTAAGSATSSLQLQAVLQNLTSTSARPGQLLSTTV